MTGLPVAGVEGSLRSRYFDDQTLAARGLVRGKTGTLRKVHTLAGFVRSRGRFAAGLRLLDQRLRRTSSAPGLAGPGDGRHQHLRLSLIPGRNKVGHYPRDA